MVTLMLWLYRRVLQCVVTVLSAVTKTVLVLQIWVTALFIIVFMLIAELVVKLGTVFCRMVDCEERKED